MEMTTEDELIMLRFIEGMHDPDFKHKLLETLQSVNLTVDTGIEFVQQLELIKKKRSITNNRTKENRAEQTYTKFYANTVANAMLGKK